MGQASGFTYLYAETFSDEWRQPGDHEFHFCLMEVTGVAGYFGVERM